MALIEFEMTSMTSNTTTLVTTGDRPVWFYGTLFGVSGSWLKLPTSAPPIDDITLDVATKNGDNGLYFIRGTCTGGAGHLNGRSVMSGLKVAAFQKGGRWIRLDRAGTAFPLKMTVGASVKKLRVIYKAVGEMATGRAPTA